MKKLLLILSFIILCGNNLYSQLLAKYTPLEGLQAAESEIQKDANDYKLIGIFTANITLDLNGIPMTTQMAVSGADIGKSDMWDYVFQTNSEIVEIGVLNVLGTQWAAINFTTAAGGLLTQLPVNILEGINFDTTLDLTATLSSDEWVSQLVQKEVGFNYESCIWGVWMPSTLEFGHTNQFNWYCVGNESDGTQTWCYSLASNTDITCETPNDIVELPAVNVEISPNPAADVLMIFADIEVKDVNIYDISGNLVKQCGEIANNIDVSGLLAGTYYISLSIGDTKIFRQFVKN